MPSEHSCKQAKDRVAVLRKKMGKPILEALTINC